MLAFMMLDSSN